MTDSTAAIDPLSRPIAELLALVGADPDQFETRVVGEMIRTSLKLLPDGADSGQLKLMSASLKEMRYAYRVFNRWRGVRKVSIFGSARTPPDHRDYVAAREFSASIASKGWMAITGGGDGIMKAGHEGPTRASSFGLSIRLPFETTTNAVIEGDPKLITFRYFFTRKLMFLSHSDAVAVFPGGFGTHDELFEVLTLIQTGKSQLVPVILIEGAGGHYWTDWRRYLDQHLLGNGWISPEDPGLFHVATSIDDAVEHVLRFYRRFHSYRFVRSQLVMRLRAPLTEEELAVVNEEFNGLVAEGRIEQSSAFPEESDHRELPRLHFNHTRRHYGVLRALIDRINGFDLA